MGLITEKLSPELWYNIWAQNGVKPYQLVIYAQVCRYFRSLADGHLEWTHICQKASLSNYQKNPKKSVMKKQRKLCSDCYSPLSKLFQLCNVNGVTKTVCPVCDLKGVQDRRMEMSETLGTDIKLDGVAFYPVRNYIYGKDRLLTAKKVVSLYQTAVDRKQELFDIDPSISLQDPTVSRYYQGGEDHLSAYLYAQFRLKRRQQVSARRTEVKRMLDIESVIGVDELIESNDAISSYVNSGVGNPRHIFRKVKCSDHIERKETLVAELARYGLKFNKKNEICDNFVESGTESMLHFVVTLMREFDWCARKPSNPKSKSAEYSEFFANQLASFDIEKSNAITKYVKFMCTDSKDFTLPRFKKPGPGVPPPSLWPSIEVKYRTRIIRAMTDLEKMKQVESYPVAETWNRLDSLIGTGCSQTLKHFLLIEQLPDFVGLFDLDLIRQLRLALADIK